MMTLALLVGGRRRATMMAVVTVLFLQGLSAALYKQVQDIEAQKHLCSLGHTNPY